MTTVVLHQSYITPQVWEKANFGGCERFLPEFRQTRQKKFSVSSCEYIFQHRLCTTFFWDDLQNIWFHVIPHIGRQCFKIKQRWAPFLPIFSGSMPRFSCIWQTFFIDFSQIFTEHARIFIDFSQIFSKSTLLLVHFHSCTPVSYTTV